MNSAEKLTAAFSECDGVVLYMTANEAKAGKITAMLGIEGGHSLDNDLENLRTFYDQGVRRLTLTHTSSTDWAVRNWKRSRCSSARRTRWA